MNFVVMSIAWWIATFNGCKFPVLRRVKYFVVISRGVPVAFCSRLRLHCFPHLSPSLSIARRTAAWCDPIEGRDVHLSSHCFHDSPFVLSTVNRFSTSYGSAIASSVKLLPCVKPSLVCRPPLVSFLHPSGSRIQKLQCRTFGIVASCYFVMYHRQ
jgi:hypothetical protein